MDTDDLSFEAYRAIIVTAERCHHDLTLQFGLLSYDCKDEDEYLNKSKKLIARWQKNISASLEYIFFEEPPEKSAFRDILLVISARISEVQKIPLNERDFERG